MTIDDKLNNMIDKIKKYSFYIILGVEILIASYLIHEARKPIWVEREIKLGKQNKDYVIVEEGLKPGEIVALEDPTKPSKNIKVEEVTSYGP